MLKIQEKYPIEIIVVDNHSGSDFKDFFTNQFSTIHWIWNKDNLGFSKANNLGVGLAQSENILILNPDTVISENLVNAAIELLHSSDKVGAVAVKMLDGRGEYLPESKRRFPNIFSAMTKFFGINGSSSYYQKSAIDNTIEVMSGACMFFKKSIYLEIGGLDERYFMYGEDIDISYQLSKKNYIIRYIDNMEMIHFKGKSSIKSNWKYQRAFYNAIYIYWDKNLNTSRSFFKSLLAKLFLMFAKLFSFAKHTLKNTLWVVFDFLGMYIFTIMFYVLWIRWMPQQNVVLESKFIVILLPLYSFAILFSYFLNGVYAKALDISNIVKTGFINIILILLIYFILPTEYKFSRVVLFAFSGFAFIIPILIRFAYSRFYAQEIQFSSENYMRVSLIPNDTHLLQVENCISRYSVFKMIPAHNDITDLILDMELMSNVEIIDKLKEPRAGMRLWLYDVNKNYLILSEGKDAMGYTIAPDTNYSLDKLVFKFQKRCFDVLASIVIIPLAFMTNHSFKFVLKSVASVLFQNTTWVYPKQYESNKLAIFPIDDVQSEDYLRFYNLRLDIYHFFKSMFIS